MNISEKKELLDFLQKLIQINSENPPGNESKIANYIKEFLYKNNICSEIIPLENGKRDSLIAKISGRGLRNIALCGHLDTVQVKDEYWSKPPFQGLIENNKMYGRGTSDMKGGIAAIAYSMILLKRKEIIPEKTIILALTADEEWGYNGAKSLTEKGYFDQTDFLIIAEPTNLCVFVAEKGELWISLKFYGKSAHGSTPEAGINSVIPGCEFILEILEKYKKIFKEDSILGRTSINVGQFHGGLQVNIVPNYSEIQFDFRVISKEDKEKVTQLIKKTSEEISEKFNVRVKIDVFNYKEPILTDPKNPYVKQFMKAAGEDSFSVARYCTDGAIIVPAKKIPFIIYGPGNIEQAHQNDEYIELSSLYRSVNTFLKYLIQT